MVLDGLARDEQRLGDLAVGEAARRMLSNSPFAGGEGVGAPGMGPARASAGDHQLLVDLRGERVVMVAGGSIETGDEQLARLHALTGLS